MKTKKSHLQSKTAGDQTFGSESATKPMQLTGDQTFGSESATRPMKLTGDETAGSKKGGKIKRPAPAVVMKQGGKVKSLPAKNRAGGTKLKKP